MTGSEVVCRCRNGGRGRAAFLQVLHRLRQSVGGEFDLPRPGGLVPGRGECFGDHDRRCRDRLREELPARRHDAPVDGRAACRRAAHGEFRAAGGGANGRGQSDLVRRQLPSIGEPERGSCAVTGYLNAAGSILPAACTFRLGDRLQHRWTLVRLQVRQPRSLVDVAGLDTEPRDLIAAQVADVIGADLGRGIDETGIDSQLHE